MIKMDNFQHFSIKSYVVDMYKNRLGEAILIHIQIYDFMENIIITVKTLVSCENFIGTEMIT